MIFVIGLQKPSGEAGLLEGLVDGGDSIVIHSSSDVLKAGGPCDQGQENAEVEAGSCLWLYANPAAYCWLLLRVGADFPFVTACIVCADVWEIHVVLKARRRSSKEPMDVSPASRATFALRLKVNHSVREVFGGDLLPGSTGPVRGKESHCWFGRWTWRRVTAGCSPWMGMLRMRVADSTAPIQRPCLYRFVSSRRSSWRRRSSPRGCEGQDGCRSLPCHGLCIRTCKSTSPN